MPSHFIRMWSISVERTRIPYQFYVFYDECKIIRNERHDLKYTMNSPTELVYILWFIWLWMARLACALHQSALPPTPHSYFGRSVLTFEWTTDQTNATQHCRFFVRRRCVFLFCFIGRWRLRLPSSSEFGERNKFQSTNRKRYTCVATYCVWRYIYILFSVARAFK